MPIKLGVVPYLNALPLYDSLRSAANIEIIAAVPSRLAPMLDKSECDVALIPVVEHLRGVGEQIISNSCIGCTGKVRSVLLFARVPFEEIQSVALDVSSRSSVALLKVIAADYLKIEPTFHDAAPDLNAMLRRNDAALLIGDNALLAAQNVSNNIRVLDLGEAWQNLTGLSFIFAAWVTRHGFASDEIAPMLDEARVFGVENSDEIARVAAQTSPVPQPIIESYFREAIEYSITDSHLLGLEEFQRRLTVHGLLSGS